MVDPIDTFEASLLYPTILDEVVVDPLDTSSLYSTIDEVMVGPLDTFEAASLHPTTTDEVIVGPLNTF